MDLTTETIDGVKLKLKVNGRVFRPKEVLQTVAGYSGVSRSATNYGGKTSSYTTVENANASASNWYETGAETRNSCSVWSGTKTGYTQYTENAINSKWNYGAVTELTVSSYTGYKTNEATVKQNNTNNIYRALGKVYSYSGSTSAGQYKESTLTNANWYNTTRIGITYSGYSRVFHGNFANNNGTYSYNNGTYFFTLNAYQTTSNGATVKRTSTGTYYAIKNTMAWSYTSAWNGGTPVTQYRTGIGQVTSIANVEQQSWKGYSRIYNKITGEATQAHWSSTATTNSSYTGYTQGKTAVTDAASQTNWINTKKITYTTNYVGRISGQSTTKSSAINRTAPYNIYKEYEYRKSTSKWTGKTSVSGTTNSTNSSIFSSITLTYYSTYYTSSSTTNISLSSTTKLMVTTEV